MIRSCFNSWFKGRLGLRFRMQPGPRLHVRLCFLPGKPSPGARLESATQNPRAAAPKHGVRPGLPPALLLVLTPVRKRLASRDFWLGALAFIWALAALALQ